MTDGLLIQHANVITCERPNRILADHALLIKEGTIAEIGPSAELEARHPGVEVLDAHSQYAMPGQICAHTHFYGAFARGMAIPGDAPDSFPQILAKLWWPLDRSLRREDVYASAQVCLVDAIRNGTTTLIDHHASPNVIDGSLDEIARAVDESGLRAVLCYETSDRDGPQKAAAGIAENMRFLRHVQQPGADRERLGAMFGLHASLTLSDETLARCREAIETLSEEAGFHIHIAESRVDEEDSLQKSGMRIVNRLNQFGILGKNTLAAHCVHVDAQEIELLAQSGTWVSHQPRSNMNNAVGLPPVEALMDAGVKVCLGNDGFTNAQWEEWKAAYLGHKLAHGDPRWMSAGRIAEIAWWNNRALAEQLLPGSPLGVLQAGARADLILVDYHPFTALTAENLPWQIVFGFQEGMISTTIASGKMLMRDHQLVNMDEEKIAAHARELSAQVWERYRQQGRNA